MLAFLNQRTSDPVGRPRPTTDGADVATLDDLPSGDWHETEVVGADIDRRLLDDAARCPAARTPLGLNVYQYEAVNELLRDRRSECRMDLLALAQGVVDGPLHELYAADILSSNGPEHLRVRTIVSRTMTPKKVQAFRPDVVAVVEDLLAEVRPGEPVEAMASFVDELPVRTICRLLGVEHDEVRRVHDLLRILPVLLSFDAVERQDELLGAYRELGELARRHLDERRRHPRADLTTAIVQATDDGDRLTPEEAERFWVGLLNAGQETTRNVLGRGLLLFADHADQWAVLHADPTGRAAGATEEVLRLAPNTPIITPRLTADATTLTLDGTRYDVPAGTVLYPVHSAANRDPRAFGTDADQFDVAREQPVPHLTFGAGPHFCAGASLARLEITETLRALAERCATVELAGDPVWNLGAGMAGLEQLPLRFGD
jgi:cytochrome P450